MNIEPSSVSEIQTRILHLHGRKTNDKNSNKKSVSNCTLTPWELPWGGVGWKLSMCNPYSYLSVPVWRTYTTCVLWSAISNMNQWNTNGFSTGFMILYVYKIEKRKKKTLRAWIFAAPYVGFLSSTLYLLVWCIEGLQSAKVNLSMCLWVCFKGVYFCHR